ncbi:hypothetical protein LTR64_005252 [Lithohypha guttulata]|uniref:uncharacterized protein n=1 Tax=Lithohypha guttulata TaxID=1690604 RepID=UPI00315C7EFC
MDLVSKHKLAGKMGEEAASGSDQSNVSDDMQRANELLSLHQNVKMKHVEQGFDPELTKARQEIAHILRKLEQDR